MPTPKVTKVKELVASYWYKNSKNIPVEFTIYGTSNNVNSNIYHYYEVYDSGGILMGTNLTPYWISPFDHFPSYDEVYDLIKDNLEKN